MISDVTKKLCKGIICVYDKFNDDIYYDGDFNPIEYKHKYSSSIVSNIRLENKGRVLEIGKLNVKYSCPSCNSENDILLKKFLYKDSIKCKKCVELDENKRKTHSNYIISSFSKFGKVVGKDKPEAKIYSISDQIERSELLFNLESNDFKSNYFKSVPTIDEFDKIIDNITFRGMKIVNYYPYISNNHSRKYSPKFISTDGNIYPLDTLTYKCDSCGNNFNGRSVKKRCMDYKILCRSCTFCNKTFKIRYTLNIKGEKIRYQSIPELDLIKFCKVNSILINNGPKIEYQFYGKKHNYMVDFQVKDILIEIKDNHFWHRSEVDSGKWKCKEDSAKEYCRINNMEYRLVMKSDIKNLKNYILKYFWYIDK